MEKNRIQKLLNVASFYHLWLIIVVLVVNVHFILFQIWLFSKKCKWLAEYWQKASTAYEYDELSPKAKETGGLQSLFLSAFKNMSYESSAGTDRVNYCLNALPVALAIGACDACKEHKKFVSFSESKVFCWLAVGVP